MQCLSMGTVVLAVLTVLISSADCTDNSVQYQHGFPIGMFILNVIERRKIIKSKFHLLIENVLKLKSLFF